MVKLGLFASIAAIITTLSIASFSGAGPVIETVDAAEACHHKKLETELVKKACADGGQAKAKEVMKAWNKEKGIKSCNQCHSKLAPTYDLKADGLEQYKKLGGK